MKYETKLQIQAALAKRGWTHAAQVINEFIEALESTDEQKALRADAERWRIAIANSRNDRIAQSKRSKALWDFVNEAHSGPAIDKAREA